MSGLGDPFFNPNDPFRPTITGSGTYGTNVNGIQITYTGEYMQQHPEMFSSQQQGQAQTQQVPEEEAGAEPLFPSQLYPSADSSAGQSAQNIQSFPQVAPNYTVYTPPASQDKSYIPQNLNSGTISYLGIARINPSRLD